MAVGRTTELFEFRRAFVWLLCAVLLPSVALVAFGVVAVANERAAVERRLAEEYGARLQVIEHELQARVEAAGASLTAGGPRDPLIAAVITPEAAVAQGMIPALQEAATLPVGQSLIAPSPAGPERGLFAIARQPPPLPPLVGRIELGALAAEVTKLPAARGPRERATFRLVPSRDGDSGISFRRIVAEVAPGARATRVARLTLEAPLSGLALDAELPGDDPAAAAAFRNRTLYIVLLVLLYTSIGVGFGLALRELYRGAQLSKLKTDFVANISHELRTPLTSVRLFAETLQSGRAKGEEVQECLDLLAAESERLSVLVEKLLDWSRLESGRRELTRVPIEVPALLDHVATAFRAQQLGATYEQRVEPGLPRIDVDREAMAQVVLNLLHNAVKYTPPEGRRIELRARRDKDKSVAIEVADNGPGVRPLDRKRIFDRFYRADDLLSRQTEGTGLGLAIAKRIVEGHGGKIELDSRVGHGSTFRVVIPAASS
jgi:signal transduction histidine kinase